jgi:hypothetical protein
MGQIKITQERTRPQNLAFTSDNWEGCAENAPVTATRVLEGSAVERTSVAG